tara:strand:- start:574 stop:783 length:210 start_codon:yes stop_codon:yes gene_type:complete
MGYNIMKVMTDPNGKPVHVLLTDGLSQILHITNQKKAIEMVKVFNQNSDSGWKYELRPSPCDINDKKKK